MVGHSTRYQAIDDIFEAVRALPSHVPADTREKPDGTLVTDLDLDVQRVALAVLSRHFPSEPVVAEEVVNGGESSHDPELVRWVVDPIDGTTNLSRGVPLFCVSVAALLGRRPLAGAVWHLAMDRVFRMDRNKGWGQGSLPPRSLSLAVDYEGSEFNRQLGAVVAAMAIRRFRSVRIIGSTALGLAWTSEGWFDVFFHPGPKVWDYAAGAGMILGAGGRVLSPEIGEDASFLLAGSPSGVDLLLPVIERAFEESVDSHAGS
jgi:myo-inositol-1(or 4)-monophosphatase